MKIILERASGSNKVTDKYESIENLINSAVKGFVDVGNDEFVNLNDVISINTVEERVED